MAPLTTTPERLRDAAGAARDDANRLRFASASSRADARRAAAAAEYRRSRATLLRKQVRRSRERRYRSAWSDLPWQMPGAELDRVLVSLDGAV